METAVMFFFHFVDHVGNSALKIGWWSIGFEMVEFTKDLILFASLVSKYTEIFLSIDFVEYVDILGNWVQLVYNLVFQNIFGAMFFFDIFVFWEVLNFCHNLDYLVRLYWKDSHYLIVSSKLIIITINSKLT